MRLLIQVVTPSNYSIGYNVLCDMFYEHRLTLAHTTDDKKQSLFRDTENEQGSIDL